MTDRRRPRVGVSGFNGYQPGAGVESALPEWWANDGAPRWITWSGSHTFPVPAAGPFTSDFVELCRLEAPTPGLLNVFAMFTHSAAGVLPAGSDVELVAELGVGRSTIPSSALFPKVAGLAAQQLTFSVPSRILIVRARCVAVPLASFPLQVQAVTAPVFPWFRP